MISNNSSIVTNGLVFNMDTSNIKSYAGPAISNVLTGINPSSISDNGSTYRAFSGTEDVYIPSYGYVNGCNYVDWYNDYNGGSGNCCPNMYYYGNVSLTGNTVYTYAILYRSVNRYTNANLMYHYEFGPSGYITEFGVHGVGAYSWQETSLGNGWYWSRAKFTTNSSTTSGTFYSFMYQYATWNRLYVAAVALMPGDYTQMHPKYWPSVGTTRTNTQVFTDLTKNNNITANSLTYGSDGSYSFNGSTDYIDCGNPTAVQLTSALTLEAWVNPTSTSGLGNIIQKNQNSAYRMRIQNGDLWAYSNGNAAVSSGGPATNGSWWHCVSTFGPSGIAVYLNGNLVGTQGTAYSASGATSGNLQIGCYAPNSETFNGKISVAKVYNRVLSAGEISQNFNALRGRYGL
jgi:Concanavalin A-like lectin/glucanases superfamily